MRYLRARLAASAQLTARRLHRELRELGYTGCYSILTYLLRDNRPTEPAPFEVRFETPPGRQAQIDFAYFRTVFTDEPGRLRRRPEVLALLQELRQIDALRRCQRCYILHAELIPEQPKVMPRIIYHAAVRVDDQRLTTINGIRGPMRESLCVWIPDFRKGNPHRRHLVRKHAPLWAITHDRLVRVVEHQPNIDSVHRAELASKAG